jgi:hypothetical protein
MNLFKKALVATAVVASFGASATVTVSSDPVQLSQEGVAAGVVAAAATAFEVDFVIGELTPAASTITLTFSENVDLTVLDGAYGADEAVVNNPGAGTGTVGAGEVIFNYGTGSFTFDNVNVDATANTITFEVNLGNPITANSAFRMSFALAAGVEFDGAATVDYVSTDSLDADIEMGTGILASEVSQYTFSKSQEWNGIIERIAQVTFADNSDGAAPDDADTAKFIYTDSADDLGLSLAGDLDVVLEGNFDNGDTAAPTLVGMFTASADTASTAAPFSVLDGDFEDVTASWLAADLSTDGSNNVIGVVYDGATDMIPVTGEVMATATVTATAPVAQIGETVEIATVEAGGWALDATVINVPYFPVGFEGTSTSVHFANEDSSAADVIVTAIDGDGNTYGPLDLGADFAGNTVTKVSQGAIMSLFGLTESAKLSVTFNIDADDGEVNAYAFTTDDTGRTEISNSQLKGK